MSDYYGGLDCGGSTTRLLVVDADGQPVFQATSGPANLSSTPIGRIEKSLETVACGCPPMRALCGCFAGLLDEGQQQLAAESLGKRFAAKKVIALPDYAAPLFAEGPTDRVCAIAGTGSLVASYRPVPGQEMGLKSFRKSGGKGYLLGDEGSAFHFGRDAIAEYLGNPEQASATLQDGIMALFGPASPTEITRAVYQSATPAALVAKMAPILAKEARDGKEYALASVELHLSRLAEVIEEHAAVNKEDLGDTGILLAGGLWKISAIYRDGISSQLSRIRTRKPIDLRFMKRASVNGAVAIARTYGD
ncbi:MAG: hypothetical protein JSS72_05630 [Armatimonadetes bacterium]|nr:hypothetical protein [Armatimonadota bacterium]